MFEHIIVHPNALGLFQRLCKVKYMDLRYFFCLLGLELFLKAGILIEDD